MQRRGRRARGAPASATPTHERPAPGGGGTQQRRGWRALRRAGAGLVVRAAARSARRGPCAAPARSARAARCGRWLLAGVPAPWAGRPGPAPPGSTLGSAPVAPPGRARGWAHRRPVPPSACPVQCKPVPSRRGLLQPSRAKGWARAKRSRSPARRAITQCGAGGDSGQGDASAGKSVLGSVRNASRGGMHPQYACPLRGGIATLPEPAATVLSTSCAAPEDPCSSTCCT